MTSLILIFFRPFDRGFPSIVIYRDKRTFRAEHFLVFNHGKNVESDTGMPLFYLFTVKLYHIVLTYRFFKNDFRKTHGDNFFSGYLLREYRRRFIHPRQHVAAKKIAVSSDILRHTDF